MSVQVQIGGIEKNIGDVTEEWIAEQIQGSRKDGGGVCVRVKIKIDDINLLLETDDCPSNFGGGERPPNEKELAVLKLWDNSKSLIRNSNLFPVVGKVHCSDVLNASLLSAMNPSNDRK